MSILPRYTLRFLLLTCVLAPLSRVGAQGTVIPLTTRRDMVFDHSGNYLYISTSDGFVRRYNIAAATVDLSYNLGGSLNGIDIAPDDSCLIVAQATTGGPQGTFHRINLPGGSVTNINYTRTGGETGGWDVAIGSNGLALVTTYGSIAPLRQIDLATNTITARSDAPGSSGGQINQWTQIARSADGTRMYFLEGNISSGPLFTYHATSNTFGASVQTNAHLTSAGAAVNRDGSILATRIGVRSASLDTASGYVYQRSFRDITIAVGFDAVRDRLYGVAGPTAEIIAYDTNTYEELYRLPIGETVSNGLQFGTGALVVSNDGRFVAIETPSGVRVFTLPTEPYPPPATPAFGTARNLVFDHAGQRLYITTAEGLVWPYNLSAQTLETPYRLDGSLYGADIAPDDSYLLVAQNESGIAGGAFQKLDLTTGAVTNLNYTKGILEGGAWDVAIGSNGIALATTNGSGSTATLRQINLATGAVTPRADWAVVARGTKIYRSADRTRMYLLEGNNNTSRFTYNATSNTFYGAPSNLGPNFDGVRAGVNRDGSLLVTRTYFNKAAMETAPIVNPVHTFNALDGGVAFDAVSDTLYGTSNYLSQIIAYDTNTFAERFRFDIGENITLSPTTSQFGAVLLVASNDGHYLGLITPTAVRIYNIPTAQLLGAVSEKSHAGTVFGVALPLDGPRTIEPRSGGANRNYTMVFSFGQNLASVGGATVTAGSASILSSMIDSSDQHRYIVDLSNVANAQTVKVTLSNVVDVLGNQTALISQTMGLLLGDTSGDGIVNAGDALQTRNRSGQATDATNFRSDVNADGFVNSGDTTAVRARSGTSLP